MKSEQSSGRPLQPGDYVRFEFLGNWAEGEVASLDWAADVVTIRVAVCSPESWSEAGHWNVAPGEVHAFGMDQGEDSCVRRVQRPLPS